MKKIILLVVTVLVLVSSGCHSYMTPKHKELVDLQYENMAAYVAKLQELPVIEGPTTAVPAGMLLFLKDNLRGWAAMYAIAHGQKPEALPVE